MADTDAAADTELRISFDGSASSLLHHRLSLAELGEPLAKLLKALRRAGSRANVSGDPQQLDLQIATLDEGSLQVQLRCVHPVTREMPEMAVFTLLDELEQAKSTTKNTAARRYLRSLPETYSSQCYTAVMPTKGTRQVTVAGVGKSEHPVAPTRVLKRRGRVARLGFEPGHEFVALTVAGKVVKYAATAALVERALVLRADDVDVRVVEESSRSSRLLRIDKVDTVVAASEAERTKEIVARWGNVLAELAK